jgi:hypothetical protein
MPIPMRSTITPVRAKRASLIGFEDLGERKRTAWRKKEQIRFMQMDGLIDADRKRAKR